MRSPSPPPLRFALLFALLVLSCKEDKPRAAPEPPPPPPPTTKPGACAQGGGKIGDSVSAPFFPNLVKSFCIDPEGETRAYGEQAKLSMDDVCTTAFDGECEVYKRFTLRRVVAVRYVDGAGKGGNVEIYLSRFETPGGAYGLYTKRVVADGDPANPSAPRPMTLPGAGAIGTGRAYVWKGEYLAELQYNNEEESPEALAQSSDAILMVLAKELADRLPGTGEKPPAAAALPEASRIAVGIQYYPKEVPVLGPLGPAAVGFYRADAKRWRNVVLWRETAEAAKSTFTTLRSKPGAVPVPGVGEEAAQVVFSDGGRKVDFVFARMGQAVFGVTDEEDQPVLPTEEKVARVKSWLAASSAAPAAPAAPAGSAPKPAPSAKRTQSGATPPPHKP